MKKLKPHTVDWAQIERFLASADKKLASAHKILAFDEEACLQQAYEAMLKRIQQLLDDNPALSPANAWTLDSEKEPPGISLEVLEEYYFLRDMAARLLLIIDV